MTSAGVVIHDPVDQPVLPAARAGARGRASTTPTRSSPCWRSSAAQGAAALVLRAPVPLTDERTRGRRRGRRGPARAQPRRAVGPPGRDAPLAARRGRRRGRRAGVARRAAVRRPVRGRQRDRLAARRADHHRGPQLAGAGLLRPAGRGRPLTRRDDPRAPGAGAVRAGPPGPRRLPRAAPQRRAGVRRAHPGATGSPCPASRSRSAPATRCSARSGPRWPGRSATSGPRRSASPPSSWRCTCCGSGPAPTYAAGCAPTCSAPPWRAGSAPTRRSSGSAWPASRCWCSASRSTSAAGRATTSRPPRSRTSGSGSATPSRCTSAAVHPRSAAAAIGEVTYGLLPVVGPIDEAEAARAAHRPGLPRPGRRPAAADRRRRPGRPGLLRRRPEPRRGRPGAAGAPRRPLRPPDRPPRRAPGRGADPRAPRPRRRPGRRSPAARWPGWSTTTAATAATWSRPCAPGSTTSATSVAAAGLGLRPPEHVPLPAAPRRRGRRDRPRRPRPAVRGDAPAPRAAARGRERDARRP